MEILSVNSKEFAPYGKVLEGYDTAELVRALGGTPITDGVEYVMSEPELERLSITKELGVRAFGGLEIQLGWCNGHNTKLNALEYHRNSEINIGADDYILLLALVTDIDENGRLDTSKVKAFKRARDFALWWRSPRERTAQCPTVSARTTKRTKRFGRRTSGFSPTRRALKRSRALWFFSTE